MLKKLLYIFIVLSAIDVYSTQIVLNMFDFTYESNPIILYFMNFGFIHFVVFKFIGVSIIIGITMYYKNTYPKHLKIFTYTLFGIDVLYIFICLNNLSFWWLYG